MTPLSINLIDPRDIHQVWPFVHRGLDDIIKKLGSRNVDFQCEDHYAAIRNGTCQLYVASRNGRNLAFVNCYVQRRPFSNQPELFVWALWALPLKERLVTDGFGEITEAVRGLLIDLAVRGGCDRILGLSTRKGLRMLGFEPGVTAWSLWLK